MWRTYAYRSHFESESSRTKARAIFRSTSQMAPGSLPFILLCCDAFDFQYQSLTVLCSCLRKVTESQRSFTKNIDEKLTQIRWRELNPSFSFRIICFLWNSLVCCDLYLLPRRKRLCFCIHVGKDFNTEFTSCAAGWIETWLVPSPTTLVASLSICQYLWVGGLQLAVMLDASIQHLTLAA